MCVVMVLSPDQKGLVKIWMKMMNFYHSQGLEALSSLSPLTLNQGRYVMERRLKEIGFTASEETPGDGSCMFHALLDQIQSYPSLPPYADNHWELRYQIVLEGYEKFINKLDWPNDEAVGSKEAWKKKMTNLNAWDDEVVLQLASNLA